MRVTTSPGAWLAYTFAAVLILVSSPHLVRADPAEMKLEAQLIWGTNDSKSPDPEHKPVTPEVARKLKSLPFKWTHYFEVTRKPFSVPTSGEKKVRLSKECEIKVKNLGKSQIEVHLYGKGEPVGKITQSLPKGELLVTGGNAANFTAWFVVLKQVD
jgi:hypothetical protein